MMPTQKVLHATAMVRCSFPPDTLPAAHAHVVEALFPHTHMRMSACLSLNEERQMAASGCAA